ncbi:unnamed protein product [Effrenium voratum]|uniref:Pentatricopeptide repeat-containing protein, chloroplastic n=1 Tax=Effrenium voratum TaxID=2562239 RepID=A0AA36NAP6_9DINO|nr:unnamed protein product [Effrenium voratum]
MASERLLVVDFGKRLRHLAQETAWQDALFLLETMPEARVAANQVCYNSVMTCLTWRSGLALAQHMEQCQLAPDQVSRGILLRNCQDWCWGIQLLKAWPDVEVNIIAFNSFLNLCTWQLALMDASRLDPNLTTCNTRINACSEHWEIAATLLAGSYGRRKLDGISYNSSLKAYAEAGRWRAALELLPLMARRRAAATARSYSSSISACGLGLRWKSALLVHSSDTMSGENSVCSNGAVAACAQAGHWMWAQSIWQRMRGLQIATVVSYSAVRPSGWPESLLMLRHLRQAELEASAISFNTVMDSCGKAEAWPLASQLLATMSDLCLAFTPVSVTTQLAALAGTAWERALEVEGLVEEASYNAMMDALACASQWQRCLCVLESMEEEVPPGPISFNCAIKACANGAAWEAALGVLDCMEARRLEVSAVGCSSAVNACEKSGRWQLGLALLHAFAGKVQPDVVSCNSAINACGRAGQWWRAFFILCSMTADLVTYSSIIGACAVGAAWVTALTVFSSIPRCIEGEVVCATLAACQRSSQWRAPLALLGGRLVGTIGYNNILSACAQETQWRRALHLVVHMPEWAIQPDEFSFGSAVHACESGRWMEALWLLAQLRILEILPNSLILSSCLAACNNGNQYRRALQLLEREFDNFNAAMLGCAVRAAEALHEPSAASLVAELQRQNLQLLSSSAKSERGPNPPGATARCLAASFTTTAASQPSWRMP